MSKHKSQGKDKKKNSQLVIRVEKAERDAFVSLCDRLDTSAAREIRRFMRELVSAHSGDGAAIDRSGQPAVSETAADAPAIADAEPAVIPAETAVAADEAVADKAAILTKKQKRAAQ